MFSRYTHGHSTALGFVLALAMERHAFTLAVLIFALGIVIGRGWLFWQRLGAAMLVRMRERH